MKKRKNLMKKNDKLKGEVYHDLSKACYKKAFLSGHQYQAHHPTPSHSILTRILEIIKYIRWLETNGETAFANPRNDIVFLSQKQLSAFIIPCTSIRYCWRADKVQTRFSG